MNQLLATPLFLGEKGVERCLDIRSCIHAVEAAFRDAAALARPESGGVLGIHAAEGGFMLKAALSAGGFFAAKVNANFPGNPKQHGLPTIQGLLILSDGGTGRALAVMHSGAVTRIRTAAATGVAIRHLSLPHPRAAALIGCGAQALDQLRAIVSERPGTPVRIFDAEVAAAESLSARAGSLGIEVLVAGSLEDACRGAQLIVTCTPSRVPFLRPGLVEPGSLVVGVGADHPEKNELDSALLAESVIITDVTEQCVAFGDLHHAIAAGAVTRADVRADLGQVVAGQVPGRRHERERIVFDSTGTPIQDVAAAELAWRRAVATGDGYPLGFDD
jgi:ornithine cyclodeaminase/alanine dehydrogenase-like protein (mu-crystallin family)